MKKYTTVVIKPSDFGYTDYEMFACELNASEVDAATEEYYRYINRTGKLYSEHSDKPPTCRNFVNFYFGGYDEYGDYEVPNRFICTNKNVASRLAKILVDLNFHDTFNQVFCSVVCDGRYIDIVRGEY